jgi:hypothetical protein
MLRLPYWAKWVAQIAGTSYSAAKSLSMEEQIYLYLELILDVLSFYVYKAEVMYMFKESSAVLELLCPHTDIFCINSYRCSDYYHFL